MTDFRGMYDIRPMIDSDHNFILSTFLKGVYYGNSWYNLIPHPIFMEAYKPVAMALISGKYAVKVACLNDDPTTVLGYSVSTKDGSSVVWVYVKEKWRSNKIGTSLMPTQAKYAVHLTDNTKPLLTKFNLVFNPFITT